MAMDYGKWEIIIYLNISFIEFKRWKLSKLKRNILLYQSYRAHLFAILLAGELMQMASESLPSRAVSLHSSASTYSSKVQILN